MLILSTFNMHDLSLYTHKVNASPQQCQRQTTARKMFHQKSSKVSHKFIKLIMVLGLDCHNNVEDVLQQLHVGTRIRRVKTLNIPKNKFSIVLNGGLKDVKNKKR